MATAIQPEFAERRDLFIDAIERPIAQVKTPIQYRLALLLATFVMVLLPLIYIAIAFAFAWVVYFHAVNSAGIFDNVRGRGVIMAVIVYVAPLFAGVTAVLFMFKPLFSRAPKQDKPTSLDRNSEPVLFAFVDKLCDSVHAPRPKRIDVDCQVNASASFRRGWLSMLLGNDLILTIGLPLASNMTARQLSGILAHEFGHFAQGGGMRLSYIVRTISHWFTRVVYERDSWDNNLQRWSTEIDIRIGIIFYLARGCVWLTRKILWVLMMIGHGVSGLLLRQMEFDADRHEVRFSGSDVIEPTTRRLHELMIAHQMAHDDLSVAMSEGRLADNLMPLISVNAEDLPDTIDEHIDKLVSEGKTGWLDTHPCDRERIVSGLKENATGVFHMDAAATDLFVDFPAVCRRATTNMYQVALGEKFRKDQVRPAEEVLAATMANKKAGKALQSFAMGGWMALENFPIKDVKGLVPTSGDQVAARIHGLFDLKRKMTRLSESQKSNVQKLIETDGHLTECGQAALLMDANFKVENNTFSRNLSSRRLVQQTSDALNGQFEVAQKDYKIFEQIVAERLWGTLALLSVDSIRSSLPDGESLLTECNVKLLPVLETLSGCHAEVMKLRAANDRFMMGIHVLQSGSDSEGLFRQVNRSRGAVGLLVNSIRESAAGVDYPFEHAESTMTVSKFLCEKTPDIEDLGAHVEAVGTMLEGFGQLYQRTLGRLCEIAQAIDDVLPEQTDLPGPEVAADPGE